MRPIDPATLAEAALALGRTYHQVRAMVLRGVLEGRPGSGRSILRRSVRPQGCHTPSTSALAPVITRDPTPFVTHLICQESCMPRLHLQDFGSARPKLVPDDLEASPCLLTIATVKT